VITHRKQQISFYCETLQSILAALTKPRSRDPTLIFGPLDIRPPVGLSLDSNEDRRTRVHSANLDQMAIWSRKCDVVSFYGNKSQY